MCNIARKVYFVDGPTTQHGKMSPDFITITDIKKENNEYMFSIEKDNEKGIIGQAIVFEIKGKKHFGYYIENKYLTIGILTKVFNHIFNVFKNEDINSIYVSDDTFAEILFTSFNFELIKIDGPNIHVVKKNNT